MDSKSSAFEILESPRNFPSDKNEYRVIRLANGMTVMLVQNKNLETSEEDPFYEEWPTCGLTVGVESLSDPSNSLGLAHHVGKAQEFCAQFPCFFLTFWFSSVKAKWLIESSETISFTLIQLSLRFMASIRSMTHRMAATRFIWKLVGVCRAFNENIIQQERTCYSSAKISESEI